MATAAPDRLSDPVSRQLALVQVLGALAYGQLRAFAVSARATVRAPSARLADELASFAEQELGSYRVLRARLAELTDLGDAAIDRQRGPFDEFFDGADLEDWPSLATLFAIGLPLSSDFVASIAPHVDDPRTAEVLREALTRRDAFETWATAQLRHHLDADHRHHDEIGHKVADLAGRMLTSFQRVIQETDALAVLLQDEADPEAAVRRLAIDVLASHRRRMVDLGLEDDDA